ncbi:copper resistance CopC family protein [Gymnodinialimonas sp. 57CJ19]|uniref:copper resistance CopC family protein n=1 Tax=Gymnodinialimonas sp. 57CJ19 TaxID=3138498 RepID=UPI0031343BFD
MKNLISASFAVALSTGIAAAHSDAMTTMPADGDTVRTAPEHVMFTFDDQIRLTRIEMTHGDTPAADLDLSDQQSFGTEFSVPVTDMGPGTYLIEWRGLGIDGHPVVGSFTFNVE